MHRTERSCDVLVPIWGRMAPSEEKSTLALPDWRDTPDRVGRGDTDLVTVCRAGEWPEDPTEVEVREKD